MDIHLDTSWCPVCSRQILPKRSLVPVHTQSQPAPAPPPSSPRSPSPTQKHPNDAPTGRRPKNATIRARGGLVHGMGRVKPNGALKRSDSVTKIPSAPLAVKPPTPVKQRTVIDQGPTPLYCSDECRMTDINSSYGIFDINYDPHRSSPPSAPVACTDPLAASESESESSGSSVDSRSSISGESSSSYDSHISPSLATLAAMYNFPPIPPPPPVFPEERSSSDYEPLNHYQSGIMMASRRLKEVLCPERPKRSSYGPYCPAEPRKPIPGWTDGSTAWRACLYSFSPPTDLATVNPLNDEPSKAYKSFSASPHRSRGVYSTLGDPSRVSTPASSLPARRPYETEELYAKYSQSLTRRSESRVSLFPPPSPTSSSPPTGSQRRERPLVKPGAEGKLLVPNVKMKVHGGSSTSLSSAWCGSSFPAARRNSKNVLSYRSDDETQNESGASTTYPGPKRPVIETRSWSYDNLKTYPIMQLPPKTEKRIETQEIDGKTVDVEVEIEIVQPLKRLFLFPGKETSLERR